jgi:imidazolonepropionase-like amidohydrolase
MIEWGLTPLKALQSATSNAAALLRLDRAGSVQPGFEADLVLWPGDPLEDQALLLRPVAVWQRGEVVAGSA